MKATTRETSTRAMVRAILGGVFAFAFVANASASEETDPTALPEPISSFGAARAGDHLYIFGGHTGKTHAHSQANITGDFRRIPVSLNAPWEPLPADLAMQGTTLVSDGTKLYRIGGLIPRNATAEDTPDLHSTDDAKVYDHAKGKWEAFTPLPIKLSSHDGAYLDGKIYIAGGWTLSGDQDGTWNGTAWALDLRAPKAEWKALPAAPFKRRALALVAAAGKLHILGGMDEDEEMTKEHDIYDPSSGAWGKGAELPEEGFGLAACEVGGAVVISQKSGKHYRLSADNSKWEEAGALKDPRFFHRIVPADAKSFIAVAGATKGPHVGSVERAEVASAASVGAEGPATAIKATIEVTEIPMSDSAAKNRQGLFLRDGQVTLFGGNNSLEQHDFEAHNFVDEAWRVKLGMKEVTKLAAFPFKRQSMQTLLMDGGKTGLVFGGFGHDGTAARTHPDIFSYNFASGEWATETIKMPKPLTQFGLIENAGDVWVFGGMDFDPARGSKNQFQIQTDVYHWKRSSGGSELAKVATELPRPRRAFGCEIADGKVYLVGGMKQEFANVMECDVYDIATNTWTQIPQLEKAFISPEMAWLGGKLYIACGSTFSDADGFQSNTAILSFDPKAAKWETIAESLPQIARHSRLVTDGEKLLIFATVQTAGGANALRVISIHP